MDIVAVYLTFKSYFSESLIFMKREIININMMQE